MAAVIATRVVQSFTHAALSPDPDLAVAALMIARVEYPKLDAGPYLDRLDALGSEARRRVAEASVSAADIPPRVDPIRFARVMALNDYLFSELRFAGNDVHYEDPRNSCLNEVLDRRTGIPITLALLYMEVARRAGVDVEGINFPGHFLLRCRAPRGMPNAEDLIIDAFHGGALLSEQDLIRRYGQPGEEGQDVPARLLARAAKPQILARMLLNLQRVYVQMHSYPQARDVTELLLAVNPSAIEALRERGMLAYHLNDLSGALRDLLAYLELSAKSNPAAEEREEHEKIWEHVKTLRRRIASLN
jgi:regulator of sirC expression with transglutaminase-like and TPR domain